MPKKLESCIAKLKDDGESKDSAYAICSAATGIKKKKGGSWTKGKKTKFDERYAEIATALAESVKPLRSE